LFTSFSKLSIQRFPEIFRLQQDISVNWESFCVDANSSLDNWRGISTAYLISVCPVSLYSGSCGRRRTCLRRDGANERRPACLPINGREPKILLWIWHRLIFHFFIHGTNHNNIRSCFAGLSHSSVQGRRSIHGSNAPRRSNRPRHVWLSSSTGMRPKTPRSDES
jgi:hypothetical protein